MLTHQIQQQKFDLTLLMNKQTGLALQNEIALEFPRQTAEVLNKVFSEFCPEDTTIRIDSLEIDLGSFSIQHFREDFSKIFEEKLIEVLDKKIRQNSIYQELNNQKNQKLALPKKEFSVEEGIEILSYSAKIRELFTQFITTGILPWWAKESEIGTPDDWFERLLAENEENFKVLLKKILSENPRAIERVLYQLSTKIIEKTIHLFSQDLEEKIIKTVNQINEAEAKIDTKKSKLSKEKIIQIAIIILAKVEFKETEITNSTIENEILKIKQIANNQRTKSKNSTILVENNKLKKQYSINILKENILKKINLSPQKLEEIIVKIQSKNGVEIREILEKIGGYIELNRLPDFQRQIIPSIKLSKNEPNKIEEKKFEIHAKKRIKNSISVSKLLEEIFTIEQQSTSSSLKEGYVNNAGIVLLSPFLPMVFQELNLLKNRQFINQKVAHKAVFFLQYLATGKTKSPEYFLLLNKILCGLPINESIPIEVKLTKKEKQEAQELLQNVIENWSAIKNTSVSGLQISFLQREGKLTRQKDDSWQLKVERKGFDMLRDAIPWGFNIIKHEWMNKPVFVEW